MHNFQFKTFNEELPEVGSHIFLLSLHGSMGSCWVEIDQIPVSYTWCKVDDDGYQVGVQCTCESVNETPPEDGKWILVPSNNGHEIDLGSMWCPVDTAFDAFGIEEPEETDEDREMKEISVFLKTLAATGSISIAASKTSKTRHDWIKLKRENPYFSKYWFDAVEEYCDNVD